MADIFDVAQSILSHYPNGISTQKLQKLTFFAQGWTLALRGKPLFEEPFEAWKFGPVSPGLYSEHRGLYSVCAESLDKGSKDNLSSAESAIVAAVIDNYGSLTGDELSALTHLEGTPWSKVRYDRRLSSKERSRAPIPQDSIKEYFEKKLKCSR